MTTALTRELERNRFFPRKLMEARHWQAEQDYHRHTRELVTRLGLGSGVLCGLEPQLTDAGTLVISAGVGVDGRGRVVVVPRPIEVDPTRPTDACGRPAEEPIDEGTVTVALCYHECGADPVCLPPEGCGTEAVLVPGMVREAYAVAVTVGATERTGLPEGVCAEVFGCESEDRRADLDRLAPRRCACDECCIPVATVTLGAPPVLDTDVRTVIRSNRELLDLILCLADRMCECCQRLPSALPPRVTGMWPWPDDDGSSLAEFLDTGRLEIAANRDLAEQGLDDPEPWLGVWLLDQRSGATRLKISRAAAALAHVGVPAGGEGAAYDVDVDGLKTTTRSVVVVMVSSTSPGPIRAGEPDQLALDPDLTGTGLSDADRAALWALAPGDNDGGLGGLAATAAGAPPLPPLPTGDGTAGGELHVVLRRGRGVATPPRLLAVWPEGASELGVDGQELEAWKLFLSEPQLRLTISRPLAQAALDKPHEWLRVWHGNPEGDRLYAVQEIELRDVTVEDLADGSVRCTVRLAPTDWLWPSTVVVQLRSTGPLAAESPVGRDAPAVLLDSDFAGTALQSQELFRLWSGDLFPDGLPALPLTSTAGETLYDGTEGGLAHWAFTVAHP